MHLQVLGLHSILLMLAITFVPPSACNSIYNLKKLTVGADFFDDFEFQTMDDPTHGRVNYVNASTAIQKRLAYTSNGGRQFTMRADSTNSVQPGQRGRDSVRIASKDVYQDAVMILDLQHMPEGCGTWPAWWTVTQGDWPKGGEIDIIEGANTRTCNLASLHTGPGCMGTRAEWSMTGTAQFDNCDANVNNNGGCNVKFSKPNSFGRPFNAMGGGWFAMQRSAECGVSIWFWSRNERASVPADVRRPGPTVNPSGWGTPEVLFSPQGCNFGQELDAHEIILNLTFCGDFGTPDYLTSGCPGNCVDLVDNNPQAFVNAYWTINSLRTYT